MQNIMNEYLKIIKNNMNQYMKYFIDNRYIKSICDEFIDVYMEIRYEGFIEIKKGFSLKNKVALELRQKKEILIENLPEKIKNIEFTYIFIDSCIKLNEINSKEKLNEELEQIFQLRLDNLLEKNNDNKNEYINGLKKLVLISEKQKLDLLKKLESNKFYLKYTNTKAQNVRMARIEHNIKVSPIYSSFAIEKAFNTGTILEDKLFVEYNLIAMQVIKDINCGIYKREYIVEFATSILEKNQKLTRLLEILNSTALQDRVILNIDFKEFMKYKDSIYEILRNGYKIALYIDETFEENQSNIQRLSLFKYILVGNEEIRNMLEENKIANIVQI